MTAGSPTIVFAEIPGRKSIGSAAALMVAANGWRMVSVSNVNQAITALKTNNNVRVLVSNEPSLSLFEAAVESHSNIIKILVTDLPMPEYCALLEQKDLQLIDHLVANLDVEWPSM
jgi:hypothetical protein